MNTRKAARRLIAIAGAFALATVGVVGATSAAQAVMPEGNPPPGQAGVDATGKLTVHKRAGAQTGAGNGTVLPTPPGDPLPGVTFSAQRVGVWTGGICIPIDLATTAGWDAAAAAVGANPDAPVTVPTEGELCPSGAAVDQVTSGPAATAVFDGLKLGLYYVVEGNAPANVVEKALPFYVTVPFPSNSGTVAAPVTTWLYDIHVYPKNALRDAPTKTIKGEQTDLVLNADVEWTVSQKIPTLTGAGATFSEASITDTLDPRLTLVSGVVSITDPVGGVNLVASDYIFTNDEGELTWTFNTAGRAKLAANGGKTLVAVITTTVTSVTAEGETPGVVDNKATVSFNSVPKDTPTPYTYWGNLVVTKQDKSNQAALAGAEFSVYERTGATCPTPAAGAVLATGTSNNTGVVEWNHTTPASSPLGLWIANSDTPLVNPSKFYCVYETKAPAGYVAITTPFQVQISTANGATLTLPVDNTKVPGPTLPLTGSTGTAMFMLGGVALLLTAGGVALVTMRRRQDASKQ